MNKTVLVLLGPTGVGKTGVSIHLARALDTEIISADSMLVYRHMDIGTAKPSPRELAEVKHHMISIIPPGQRFNAGMFAEKAGEIIRGLHGKKKIPVVVGGTGLYIRTLTQGLFEGPAADEPLREKLIEEGNRYGSGHLHERLKAVDPGAAEKIAPNDRRRIVRALEVSMKSGRGISEIQRESTRHPDYAFIKAGLTRDRKELYGMIEKRVDDMIDRGLLDETRRLLEMKPDRTAMQALGYKEMKLYLDGMIDFGEAVRLIKKRTKMYAKRQMTWFRKEPGVLWADITGIMDKKEMFQKVLNDVRILKNIISSGERERTHG